VYYIPAALTNKVVRDLTKNTYICALRLLLSFEGFVHMLPYDAEIL